MIDKIIAYENGELDEDGVIDLFQKLLDSGQVWHLQGSYGRTCQGMIEAGLLNTRGQCEISDDECHGDTHQPVGHDLWFCEAH